MDRERIKAALMEQMGEEVDKLLDWREGAEAPNLAEYEAFVLQLRKRLSERLLETMIEQEEAAQPVPGPRCRQCGQEMRNKGKRAVTVESQVGSLRLERSYYTCPRCGEAFFPSGPTTRVKDPALE